MLYEVMNYCKNFFVYSGETDDYEIEADGIKGNLAETYLVGMYVCIDNSFLNDGVYKITGVTSDKLTLDATLQAENTGDTICLYGLKVPSVFITLVDEIESYDSTVQRGVKSESQGQRSVTYGSGSETGSGDNTWQSVYANTLLPYMRIVSDKDTFMREYNMTTKSWC